MCSSPRKKKAEVTRIRNTLKVNNYPNSIFNNLDSNSGSRNYKKRVVLPYVRGCGERLARVLRKYDVDVFYKPINKLKSIFGLPKDKVPIESVTGVVYEIPCSDCNKKYVGQTGNSLHTRLQQHRAACRLLQPEKSALAQHSIEETHQINWAEAKVVERSTNWRQRLFKEAYVTARQTDAMNRCEMALPAVYKKL